MDALVLGSESGPVLALLAVTQHESSIEAQAFVLLSDVPEPTPLRPLVFDATEEEWSVDPGGPVYLCPSGRRGPRLHLEHPLTLQRAP